MRSGLVAHQSRRDYPGPEKFIDLRGLSDSDIVKQLQQETTYGGLMPAAVVAADKQGLSLLGKDGENLCVVGESAGAVAPSFAGRRRQAVADRRSGGAFGGRRGGCFAGGVAGGGGGVGGAVAGRTARCWRWRAGLTSIAINSITPRRRGGSRAPASSRLFIRRRWKRDSLPPACCRTRRFFCRRRKPAAAKVGSRKNYDGKALGPISMRRALAKSRNLATVQLLKYIGALYAQDYILRFGFRKDDMPPYLAMGLGAARRLRWKSRAAMRCLPTAAFG